MAGEGGYLTTHVLDAALGLPASGMTVDLYAIEGDSRRHLRRTVTNDDGRTDAPVLPANEFATGVYELVFHAGGYLDRVLGPAAAKPRFLDVIPLRFGISDPAAHYHVPLLLSPHSYSTYRGS